MHLHSNGERHSLIIITGQDLDEDLITHVASLCRSLQRSPMFPRSLQKHAGLTEASVRPCAAAMAALHRKAPNASLVAVYKKYCSSKYLEVAKMADPPTAADQL